MSSKRILLVTGMLALAVLLAATILALRRNEDARAAAPVWFEHGARPDAGTSDLEATRDRAPGTRALDRAVAAAPLITAHLPPFALVDGPRLIVVERDTHKPLPGADVRVWEKASEETGITRDFADWIGPDLEAFMRAHGKQLTSDDEGAVDLAAVQAPRFVVARSGDLFGFMEVDPFEVRLAELPLSRQHTITVVVRDAHGAVRAGVHVGLGRCDDADSFWDSATDARGECHIANIETLLGMYDIQAQAPFAVRIAAPCRPRVEEWLYADRLPATPVELVLPASGSLRVTLVDEAQHRVPLAGSLAVRTDSEIASGRPQFADMTGAGRYEFVDGIAIVPDVGLGLELSLEADLPGTGDASTSVRGPSVAGEEIAIRIPFESDHTLLHGRLVDEAGQPLAHGTFDWRRLVDDGHAIQASGRDRIKTDAEGRFTWTLRRSAHATGDATHRTGYFCELSKAPRRLQATVDFALEIGSEVTDLGDIVMALGGPLVAGKIVDEQGHGVQGAFVATQVWNGEEGQNAETFDAEFSDADGAFAVFGPCLALEFVLAITCQGLESQQIVPFACTGGNAEVSVHAKTIGSVEGTALVDREWTGNGLDVQFVRDDKSNESMGADWSRAGDRLCFRFAGQRPGRGRVTFQCDDAPGPVLVVPNVEIQGGVAARPAELVDVDLRGKLQKTKAAEVQSTALALTVVDAHGQPIPRGIVWIWQSEENGFDETLWAGGRVPAIQPPVARIEIWAPGSRARVLMPPFTSGRVVLAPELDVELDFDLPKELRDEHLVIVGSLYSVVDERDGPVPNALSNMNGFRLDRAGNSTVSLPAAGRFSASLAISRQGVQGFEDVDGYELSLPGPFEARDTDGRQVVKLAFDPASLKQCLVDLGLEKQ